MPKGLKMMIFQLIQYLHWIIDLVNIDNFLLEM